jgi:adenine-specific DNA-methyltransferase
MRTIHKQVRAALLRKPVAKRQSQKEAGAYYTPDPVVGSLLRWVIRRDGDRLLDPSCGDGRFIAGHQNAVGIEQDMEAAHTAMKRARWAQVHENDFFSWASEAVDRFECAAGNPPFIRYQSFKGEVRSGALDLCRRLGADFSNLTSSWAPFLVATAGLLKAGGRMAFVVPAEIGHAPYSVPLLEYLLGNFSIVHVIAVREKLFPDLSEDCWLLYVEDFGGKTNEIRLTIADRFKATARPPHEFIAIAADEWRNVWNRRLRPYLIGREARTLYQEIAERYDTRRLGDLASVGIGYVSGANGFFHLRPSQADQWTIPERFLQPTVRNGRALPNSHLTKGIVEHWKRNDDPVLLLRLPKTKELPDCINRYLDTDDGRVAREAYKCRTREPWYSVPDVQVPDYFLSYMCGLKPVLVRNDAQCTCTNSVHSVRLKPGADISALRVWDTEFVKLSFELQGHPLGGGMLKLEPREATKVVLPTPEGLANLNDTVIGEAVGRLRAWRHYASPA